VIVKPDISMSEYLIAVSQKLEAMETFLIIGAMFIVTVAWVMALGVAYRASIRKRYK